MDTPTPAILAGQPDRGRALRITLGYAVLAALWILLSDRLLDWLFTDPTAHAVATTVKGWVFVAGTAGVLFLLLTRRNLGSELLPADTGRAHRRVSLAIAATVFASTAAGIAVVVLEHRSSTLSSLRSTGLLRAAQADRWWGDRLSGFPGRCARRLGVCPRPPRRGAR